MPLCPAVPWTTAALITLPPDNAKAALGQFRLDSIGYSPRRCGPITGTTLRHAQLGGDHRLTIHVFPGTQTFGRGGFFIHGGTHAGSAGCINLRGQMESFAADLKAATGNSDCYVPLTVRYP